MGSENGTTGTVTIRNSGSISAEGYAAIDLTVLHVDRIVLVNSGDLNVSPPGSPSAPLAYAGSDGRDILLNHGSIQGEISLGGGSDVFRDTGPSARALLTILGGDGDDRISGGDGANLIIGGAGGDVMRGGGGADIFAYTGLFDSSAGGGGSDRIRGFDRLNDVIDLSGIDADGVRTGDQASAFIGTNAFSGNPGELRCDLLRGSGAVVYADVDGDAVSDFTLVVGGDVNAPEDLHFIL